jgi:ADP-ribosylglycohydrolase
MNSDPTDRLHDRFRGALLGLAVGDALGMPLEGMRAEEIRQAYGIVADYLPGWGGIEAGEGTDDTHQMLAIAESYIERGRLDIADIARRFLEWFTLDGRGIGRTTRSVLTRLAEGESVDSAAYDVARDLGDNAAGNGSLMRCAPTGLLRMDSPDALRRESAAISAITHADPRCIDACILMNTAIARVVSETAYANATGGVNATNGKDVPGGDDAESVHAPLLPYLLDVSQNLHPRVHAAVAALTTAKPYNLRTGGYVIETLQAGLWAALHARNFEEGMIALLTLGGDTDTTCAVGGALLGARFGMRGIPARWLDGLKMRDRVLAAADGLWRMAAQADNSTRTS